MSFSRQQNLNLLKADLSLLNAVTTMYLAYECNRTKKRKSRRYSVNPLNRERRQQGFYANLVAEMRLSDKETFFNFHRMSPATFDELLSIVGPFIKKMDVGERSVTAGERLSLTIRYLASGDSMVSIGFYGFRLGKSTTSSIIRETCQHLWRVLKETVFPVPTDNMWRGISNDFEQQWNFPHCLGAMDGKHVLVQAFRNAGSVYRNYKYSHSIVLFAICDANYKFIIVDVGAPGHVGDSTIFRRSNFGRSIIAGGAELNLPPPQTIRDNQTREYPFVFVGDEAFPLLTNLMRPYPGRNTGLLPPEKQAYNYRLSRARRVVENAFGILASRWRIYRRPIIASETTVQAIIKATVVLHNWLRDKKLADYVSPDFVDTYVRGTYRPGRWRNETSDGILSVNRVSSNNPSINAKAVRDLFASYFNEVDILPWQYTSDH